MTCKHEYITGFKFESGEAADLWACVACGHKFWPADDFESLATKNGRLQATISRLREYIRHKPSCYWWQGPSIVPTPCDCGYDELMEKLEESK